MKNGVFWDFTPCGSSCHPDDEGTNVLSRRRFLSVRDINFRIAIKQFPSISLRFTIYQSFSHFTPTVLGE
jgi:hypothetical protein